MSGWSQLKGWKFRGCIVINNTDFPRKVTPLNSPSMVPSTAPSKVSFHSCHWNQEAWAFFPVRRYYVRACSVRSIYLWRMGTKSPYSLPLIKATGGCAGAQVLWNGRSVAGFSLPAFESPTNGRCRPHSVALAIESGTSPSHLPILRNPALIGYRSSLIAHV